MFIKKDCISKQLVLNEMQTPTYFEKLMPLRQPYSFFNSFRLILIAVSAISLSLAIRVQWGRSLYWDLNPIMQAIDDYAHGLNPYEYKDQSMFIYHPWILRCLYFANETFNFQLFLIFLYIVIPIWFIFQSYRFLYPSQSRFDAFTIIFTCIGFGGVSVNAILCGNFSAYFHLILVSLIFQYTFCKSKAALSCFSFAIVCFALVKPYFLAYVLFYFFIYSSLDAIKRSLLCIIAFLLLWYSAQYLVPMQYAQFVQALQYQLLTKDDLGGFSTLRLLGPVFGYQWAFLFHLIAVGGIFAVIMKAGKSSSLWLADNKMRLLAVLFCVVAINPRMVFYDFFMLIFILFYFLLLARIRYGYILTWGCLLGIYSLIADHAIRWILISYTLIMVFAIYKIINKIYFNNNLIN